MKEKLLAVDLGLKTGMALFDRDGSLLWYRSQNYGNYGRLKRAVAGVLFGTQGLSWLVLEGDRNLASVWGKVAQKKGVGVIRVSPEVWRSGLLLDRQRRSGADAKRNALDLAQVVIARSNAPKSLKPNDDAAEAILIGVWGLLELGWSGSLGDHFSD